ncbi:MAG TPA: lysophospholipid acyltransferase family protein [Candidatus Paceibacterota bacterium]|nr:lysophospholipid acyltransferase family protein [Verrucomicrobiota bacterium]HOX02289.1 lysophospholipid acyltransferase family protein [Verrucomicrobiota bacterium]HRZ45081.1 lysophospholipid acyltransferase family protein [Candidatus Paceibacterota bacterium]
MDTILYLLARALVSGVQQLPLAWAARLGRAAGAAAFVLDVRHRRIARDNLRLAFGATRSPQQLAQLNREHFRRLGENYACAIRTAAMSADQIRHHLSFLGTDQFLTDRDERGPRSCVIAIGHFGNFELYARYPQFEPAFRGATTYRGLRQPGLNRLLKSLRERTGCMYFDRRTDAAALRAAFTERGFMLGLLADQHAGRHGIRLPFLGHECSTSPAPAIFARRYNARLFTAYCFRNRLAHWSFEVGREIPLRDEGRLRSVVELTQDVNRDFERAVLRDPANWFWVHNRWKPARTRPRPTPAPTHHAPTASSAG